MTAALGDLNDVRASRTWWQPLVASIGVALAFLILPRLAPAELAFEVEAITLGVINGLILGVMLRLPARYSLPMAAGAGVGLLGYFASLNSLGPRTGAIALVIGAELWLMAALLRRTGGWRLQDARDFVSYVLPLAGVSAAGGLVVLLVTVVSGDHTLPLHESWLIWVVDDLFGAVVITPAIITATGIQRSTARQWRWTSRLEWAVAAAFSLAMTWQVFFAVSPGTRGVFDRAFYVALGSLWIAVRLGLRAVTPVIAVQYWLGAVGTASGRGILATEQQDQITRLLAYEVLATTLALVTLALAVLRDARVRASREVARSEALLRDVIDGSPAIVFAKSYESGDEPAGRYILTNEAWARFTALPDEQSRGRTDEELWGLPRANEYGALDRRVVETAQPLEILEERADAAGTVHSLQTAKFPLRGPDGTVWGVGAIATDVTELTRIRRELEGQTALLTAVFDRSPTPALRLSIVEGSGIRIIEANRAFSQMLGCSDGCIERAGLLEHLDLDGVGWAVDLLQRAAEWAGTAGEEPHAEVSLQSHDGSEVLAVMYAAAIVGRSGEQEFVVQFDDVTARKAAESALRSQATRDPVTGLPNRRVLIERIATALATLDRRRGYLAVLFCDLDRFKEVNDTLGHHTGDEFLGDIARRLSDAIRPGDTVARLGGDEFVVLAEGLHEGREAITLALRLQDRLSEPWTHEGRTFRPAMSVGIALAADRAADVDELLRRADLAMYRAKDAGRNRIEMYDAHFDEEVRHSVALQQEIRTAIDRDRLVLAYQPIVELVTKRRVGAEALIRMRSPEGELRLPADFVPQAESTGLIVPVGWWVIRRALDDLASEASPGESFVSINVSAVQLRDAGISDLILEAAANAGVAPSRLTIEVTETSLIHDAEHSRRELRRLHDAGVAVALDDFGTGYSSLTWLTHFPVDVVKIDRSFIRDLLVDDRKAAIVTAMISVSHELGLTVVAEGVETEGQRLRLIDLGCDRGQGYLFGRPEPLS